MLGSAEGQKEPAETFSERNEMTESELRAFYNCSNKTDTKRWTEGGVRVGIRYLPLRDGSLDQNLSE
jgi:hypothetical protein